MKYIKKFEDVYYPKPPENFYQWKERITPMYEEFINEFVDRYVGLEIVNCGVVIETWRILLSVTYKKEERIDNRKNFGKTPEQIKNIKEMAKKEWRSIAEDMINELDKEFGKEHNIHLITENGYMIEKNLGDKWK